MKRTNTLYDLETTAKFWLLQLRGTKIQINRDNVSSAYEWCSSNVKKQWAWHHKPDLIDDKTLVQNLRYHFTREYTEDQALSRMAEEISEDLDHEILFNLGVVAYKQAFFWFEDDNEAMRFKLSWGER
jgi:hypothetical protein